VKLIAEPWDIGPGGYQVGQFPPGWAEWNDKFRDTVRSFWKGDGGVLPDFAKRISGSGDLFNKRGRKPWASINFITAHDGFNLDDLVSYNDKHNEANGEENRDGHSNNHSWNHGVEGPTDDEAIVDLRERQKRNLLATVLLSLGTPMLLAGDEFGHTQQGNNNAYAQDNPINWPNWLGIAPAGRTLREFTRRLIATRKAFPILHRSRFLVGSRNEEIDVTDVTWLTPVATEMTTEQWQDGNARCFGMLLDGRAQESGIKRRGSDATLLIIYNAHHDIVRFTLPDVPEGKHWLDLIDTARPESVPNKHSLGKVFDVAGRSLCAFVLVTEGAPTSDLRHGIGSILDITERPLE
jgi:glycogen operon protein